MIFEVTMVYSLYTPDSQDGHIYIHIYIYCPTRNYTTSVESPLHLPRRCGSPAGGPGPLEAGAPGPQTAQSRNSRQPLVVPSGSAT